MNTCTTFCIATALVITQEAADALAISEKSTVVLALAFVSLALIAALLLLIRRALNQPKESWDSIPAAHIEAMDETIEFIQHDDGRTVDTRKDPLLLAAGVIEHHKRPSRIRAGHVIGAVAAIVVLLLTLH